MAVLWRWTLVLTLLLAAAARLGAASAEDRAFEAAAKAFQDGFHDRAEAQFADFSKTHPASPLLTEAILLQAQARLELSNYAGAIQLLSANQGRAGTNADQYLFWLAEAHGRKGDWRAASDGFGRVLKEFPASSRVPDAAVGEVSARAALAQTDPAEWPRLLNLLQQTNGIFQSAFRTNAGSPVAVQGRLLLSEALLAVKDYAGAEETLQPLAKTLLKPRQAWQWQYLLCRAQLAAGRPEAALQGTTNLLTQARDAGDKTMQADSAAFQAGLFERLGRTNEAVAAYQQNLAVDVPPDRQRQAVLKGIALLVAQGRIPEAAQMLEKFLGTSPEAASADLALLTLGELRLRGVDGGPAVGDQPPTPAAATTNLQLAIGPLNTLVTKFPNSSLVGKAQLDLGWCYWREGNMPKAEAAFQAAVERLPVSSELATAHLRLADTQFQQSNYAGALSNYGIVVEKFGALPEVRTNFFEHALVQTVRAGLAAGQLATATNALQKALVWYPDRLNTARAVLLTGQEIRRRGDPAGERAMLQHFARTAPQSPLLPELELAIAASFEQEKKWTEAIAQYGRWLASFTNSEARPRAEYNYAWATAQAGQLTNALALFTRFVAQFPAADLAPFAQMWVADYYFNARDFIEAERHYKLLFQNTNWAGSELAYESQLMAGRAAVNLQRWKEAKDYFTGLYNNPSGPGEDLRLQAFFEYGQSLMQWVDPTDTNKLANLEMATQVFGRICDQSPTNRLAIPAWIERGNCYLQWALARQQLDSLTNALNAYQRVVDSPQADVAARSEAKLGQAIVFEKWAEQKTAPERAALLKQALSNCLDVVYGNILRTNEELPLLRTKEAGIKAFNLAESLQAWPQLVNLYDRLTNNVWPELPDSLAQRAAKARERLSQER